MPELEHEIAAWRTRMAAALPGRPETVQELESHLRDHIETLRRTGVAPEAAFAAGLQRLGEVHGLAREFDRAHARGVRASGAVAAVLGLLAVTVVALAFLLAAHLSAGRMTVLLAAHVFAVSAGYLTVLATGLLGMWALLTARARPLGENERQTMRRTVFHLTVANCVVVPLGVGLGMRWAAENHGRAWSWERVEVAALLVMFSTALLLLGHFTARFDDRARWLLAVLGATTVALGLFNATWLTSTMPFGWLVVGLLVAQAMVTLLRPAKAMPPDAKRE